MGSVGIKTTKETELRATINYLLGVQVYLASFFFDIHGREGGGGEWGRRRESSMGEEEVPE